MAGVLAARTGHDVRRARPGRVRSGASRPQDKPLHRYLLFSRAFRDKCA
jgi:hypothetical protein